MLGKTREKGLTSWDLPNASLVYCELVLGNLDFDRAGLDGEDHVHLAAILRALHLLCMKFDDTPIEERSYRGYLLVLERAVTDSLRLDPLLRPCDICSVVSRAEK